MELVDLALQLLGEAIDQIEAWLPEMATRAVIWVMGTTSG